jgi:fucose 4-O-acetylase-like acetyltransferase
MRVCAKIRFELPRFNNHPTGGHKVLVLLTHNGAFSDWGFLMRDTKIDNAKGVLIVLVVFGHLLESSGGWANRLFSLVLTGIYMFHMPAFIFLSGMTAKIAGLGGRVAKILIMLAAFQAIYVSVLIAKNGVFAGTLLQPYWLLWFLLSLIWWMVLLPVIKNVPFSFAVSIAIALCAGLIPWAGYPLSIARTLVFFPFFVAGALYGKQVWSFLSPHSQWRYLALLAVIVLAFTLHHYGVRNAWFYGSFRYDQLEVDGLSGILTRGALLAAATVATVSVFVSMPEAKTIFSKAGRNSLSVFLLHGLFVVIAGPSISEVVKQVGPWTELSLLLIISGLLVAFLSANFLDEAIRRGVKAFYDFFVSAAKIVMLRSRG